MAVEGIPFSTVVIGATSGIFSLLMGGNIFFIKKLVNKLDTTAESQKITSIQVSHVDTSITEMKKDIKELNALKIDVAILKTQINNPQGS